MSRTNKTIISFKDGQAAEHVTGSCVHINNKNTSLLLECGLSQSNNTERDYLNNKAKFSFSVKDLDFIFLGHAHLDHSGRIPLLFKRGCHAALIVPQGTKRILQDMYADSVKIMERDAAFLSMKKRRDISPIYNQEDVDLCVAAIVEYPFNQKIKLNDFLSFRFSPSGHIAYAAQIELWITEENQTTKKILYTSDLGNLSIPKHFTESFVPCESANIVIGETTYGDGSRPAATLKNRKHDVEKIATIIQHTCLDRKGRVLFPSFALDRLAELLLEINNILKTNQWDIPIVIDTPLGIKHLQTYCLIGEQGRILNEIIHQDNVRLVSDYNESKLYYNSQKPMIILSSSGMMTAGRVLNYLPYILRNKNNYIVFCGYATEGSLAAIIKHSKKPYLKIGDRITRNACGIISLNSFSSHMQYTQLLDYYTSINCEKIVLVHGETKVKNLFAADLSEQLSKNLKSAKVINANRGVEIYL